MSILLRLIDAFMSMSRYSAEGLYTMTGRYWFVSDTGISKSDTMLVRLELFQLLAKLSVAVSPYVMGILVLVEMIGSIPVQNTTLAIGFHIAKLETSCVVWYIEWGIPVLSFTDTMLAVSGVN